MNALRDGKATWSARSTHWRAVTRCLVAAALIFTLTGPAMGTQQAATSPQELLGQAMHQETAMGDLTAAIELYERVVAHRSVDLSTRLQAELRLADLLAKTGDSAAARELLERIVADGSLDAAPGEIADAAREALAALGVAAGSQNRVTLPNPEVETGFADYLLASPDGRYGLFTNYGGESQNVGVVEYATGEITWMTRFESYREGMSDGATWAPDSKRVAYLAMFPGGREVRITSIETRDTEVVFRQETEGDARPQLFGWLTGWTRDGSGLLGTFDLLDEDVAVISILDIRSGEMRQLTTTRHNEYPDPKLSPDGRYIAFRRIESGNSDIYTLSVDGSQMERLTSHPGDDGAWVWSRDGGHILFVSDRVGRSGLWAVPVEEGKKTGSLVLIDPTFHGGDLRWVGEQLSFYPAERAISDVFTVSIDPETAEVIGDPGQLAYEPRGYSEMPALNGHGTLAFQISQGLRRGRRLSLAVIGADGTVTTHSLPREIRYTTGPLRLHQDGSVVSFPAVATWPSVGQVVSLDLETRQWSTALLPEDAGRFTVRRARPESDSDTIFYIPQPAGGPVTPMIRRYDLRSGESTTVWIAEDSAEGLRWLWASPDGDRLRFAQGSAALELDVSSGEVTQLAFDDVLGAPLGPYPETRGAYTNDGRRLAIGDDTRLRVIDLETGVARDLDVGTDEPAFGVPDGVLPARFGDVAWSPRGDRLAFIVSFGGESFESSNSRVTIDDPLEAFLNTDGSR